MDFYMLIFKSVGSLFILFLLTSSLGKKQIKYWYDQDKADNGSFTIYAYKLIDTA